MKNLKRALSLVLSTAMLLGMMVVGTGAAHTDVKAEHNEEAIAVVTAAGIMGAGDTFNPDGEITRGEMAVVMVNMLDLDVKDYKGTTNFTDAGWAADYIDAVYAEGVMAGVSATEFGTNVKVTTAQAALMMLKALGYFEYAPINDWMLDTIKKASKIDLLKGIDAKASAVLTRNEVAQLVLNTLLQNGVEEEAEEGGLSIKGEGFEITQTAKVTETELEDTLMERLFGDEFEKKATTTKLGLPAEEWIQIVDDEEEVIITIEEKADEVVIAEEEISVAKLFADEVNDDEDIVVNSDEKAYAGDVVYYYEVEDEEYDAYVVDYELVELGEIKEPSKSEKKDGYEIKVNGKLVAEGVEFDYEEGDYVLVVINGKEIVAAEAAEVIEGKVKAIKGDKYTIDGEKYVIEDGADIELSIGTELTAALNKAGQIAAIIESETAKSDDYAYIYNLTSDVEEGEENEDGFIVDEDETTYTVYVILADGSKAKYTLAEDETVEVGTVVPYSINKDDEFEVAEGDYAMAAGAVELSKDSKSVVIDGEKVYADSKTEFIFVSSKKDEGKVWSATTATGIKNVEIDDDAVVIYDEKTVLFVFVMGKDEGLTVEADTEYAILIDEVPTVTEDEDENELYTYTVFADGEETELTFEAEITVKENDIFAYEMDGDYAEVVASELVKGTVEYEGEDYFEIDGDEYVIADDAEIYVITWDAEEEEYSYGEGEIAEELEIFFIANDDDEITLAFYYETINADEE